ncbi:MAG: acetyltransferase [Pseudomonadota bacterium]
MAELLILGAGGHGRVVADAALASGAWSRVFACDRNPARAGGELLPGVTVITMGAAFAQSYTLHVAIGNAANRETETAATADRQHATVIHPHASVSSYATMVAGCFIAAQAVIAPGAAVGRAVIVNHGAVVDHDVVVGEFSHVAPGAVLGGGVHVGRRVLVGAGATVLPGIRIADDVTIGAGAVVSEPITESGIYAGVPARRLK